MNSVRKKHRRKEQRLMDDLINLILNSSVTIVIIAYFIYRDNKFMGQLQQTLTTLVDTVDTLKDTITASRDGKEV